MPFPASRSRARHHRYSALRAAGRADDACKVRIERLRAEIELAEALDDPSGQGDAFCVIETRERERWIAELKERQTELETLSVKLEGFATYLAGVDTIHVGRLPEQIRDAVMAFYRKEVEEIADGVMQQIEQDPAAFGVGGEVQVTRESLIAEMNG